MKVMLISTAWYAIDPNGRYQGIERLVYTLSEALKKKGVDVSVAACEGSELPKGVEFIPTIRASPQNREDLAFQNYRAYFEEFQAFHDFSHTHIAPRRIPNLPSVNMVWHSGEHGERYPKADYNLMCLSRDHAVRINRLYGRPTRYIQLWSDPSKYQFSDRRGDRFLFIGRAGPEKGGLDAIRFCKELDVPLDVVSGRRQDNPEYADRMFLECDGKRFWCGEVSEEVKLDLMRHAKAILYPVGQIEGSCLTLIEAMLTGCPAIVYDRGGMRELVGDTAGFVVDSPLEFKRAMERVGEIEPRAVREFAEKRYSTDVVAETYLEMYRAVAGGGYRW